MAAYFQVTNQTRACLTMLCSVMQQIEVFEKKILFPWTVNKPVTRLLLYF